MRALIYDGPGKGDVPTCAPGRILGHEGVGVVEAVGAAVANFKPGDHVLISCITACGRCDYCRRGIYSHCTSGGWILGNAIDGTQAEYVRLPHADTSLYPVPPGTDEEALVMLSDILPTGFECGVLNGKVAPGSTVAIVGAGPIGLATLLTAQFYSPGQIIMIDIDANRLAVAEKFGATRTIDSRTEDPVAASRQGSLTDGGRIGGEHEPVGRHQVSGHQSHRIAGHQIAYGQGDQGPIPHRLRGESNGLSQRRRRRFRTPFLHRVEDRRQQDHRHNQDEARAVPHSARNRRSGEQHPKFSRQRLSINVDGT